MPDIKCTSQQVKYIHVLCVFFDVKLCCDVWNNRLKLLTLNNN